MRWPWVSRERFDDEREARRVQMIELRESQARLAGAEARVEMAKHNLAEMRLQYDTLFAAYRELRVAGANPSAADPAQLELPSPDLPPDEVMAAIAAISPTRDKTYDANWGYWERNKARAAQFPADFAQEILDGVEVTT